MVRKVVDMEYMPQPNKLYQQIRFTLNESSNPHLLKDTYCTHIVVSWYFKYDNPGSKNRMAIYAVHGIGGENSSVEKITEWEEISILDAIEYIYKNLS